MKILLQLGVVLAVYWVSQLIEFFLPFSFPASVISLILLLVLLLTGLVKHNQVKDVADFLLGNLVFLFIPVATSIIKYVDVILTDLGAFVVICVVSLILTYAATSYAVQLTQKLLDKRGAKKCNFCCAELAKKHPLSAFETLDSKTLPVSKILTR